MHSKILKNKVSIKLLYVLLFSIFFSSYLFANDSLQKSIEQGKIKSQTCIACHGVDGNSVNPQWPSIAQQSKSYIVNQLKYFRDGKRKNVLMNSIIFLVFLQSLYLYLIHHSCVYQASSQSYLIDVFLFHHSKFDSPLKQNIFLI